MQPNYSTIKNFLRHCKQELHIETLPKISMIKSPTFVQENRSFGAYYPQERKVEVFITNRNLADICRSLAHELVHHRQNELGMLYTEAGETGSDIENDANAMAGILLRDYGKQDVSVYDLPNEYEQDIQATSVLPESKQVGTLYHYTDIGSLYGYNNILVKGLFFNEDNARKGLYSISTTRSYDFGGGDLWDFYARPVRVAIDGDAVSTRYKVAPINQDNIWQKTMGRKQRGSKYGGLYEERIYSTKRGFLPTKYYIKVDVLESAWMELSDLDQSQYINDAQRSGFELNVIEADYHNKP